MTCPQLAVSRGAGLSLLVGLGWLGAVLTCPQGWQVVAKSGLNHWFVPVKTGWQKMWVAKSGKK